MTDAGDFAPWYASVADGLTRRIVAAIGDPVLGREAAAEAFARAYERWDRVRLLESPEGWVYRTAQNICRNQWRRRRIEKRALEKLRSGAETTVVGPHDIEVLVAETDPSEVSEHVQQLPERMRTAIRLRYWEHLSETDVADRMGVSDGTASATLSQARRRLRSWLSGERPDHTRTARR